MIHERVSLGAVFDSDKARTLLRVALLPEDKRSILRQLVHTVELPDGPYIAVNVVNVLSWTAEQWQACDAWLNALTENGDSPPPDVCFQERDYHPRVTRRALDKTR
jgi:hypothetical protein